MSPAFPIVDAVPEDGFLVAPIAVERAPLLGCSTVVPEHFRRVTTPPAVAPSREAPITSLGVFRDPDDQRPVEVEIYCGWLEREVSPADWLEAFLRTARAEVVERRVIERDRGGDALEALTRRTVGEHTFLSRWSVFKEGRDAGAHVFLVEARARDDVYASVAEQLAVSAGAFLPERPSTWPYAEPLKSFARGRPGDFLVYHPMSWTAGELPTDDASLRAMIDREVDGEVLAQIELRVKKDALPDELVALWATPMAERGLSPRLPELVEREPFGGLEAAWVARGHATPEGREGPPPIDLHVTVGRRGDVTYLFGLFGPARAIAPDLAAVHERAYGTVLEQLVTADVPEDEEPAD